MTRRKSMELLMMKNIMRLVVAVSIVAVSVNIVMIFG